MTTNNAAQVITDEFMPETSTDAPVGPVLEVTSNKKAVKNVTTVAVVGPDPLAISGLAKLAAIGRELQSQLFERENEVRSILLGAASGKHVLLLGPPGTGKSMLAELFSKHISGATYFQWLLNRTSDPSELLGPISIKAMEKDQFLRKPAGKLPEAHIAFIDEIFKSNSATLNILLPLMNEGIWYNDGVPQKAQLKVAIGASNEFPEDEELDAFFDRFIFRHWVSYVGDSQNQANMLKNSALSRAGKLNTNRTILTLEELEAVQAHVNTIAVTDPAINALLKLQFELKKKDIHISDRRLNTCLHVMQANAAMDGRNQVDPDDMEPLTYVLWERKEDVEDIAAQITKMMNPFKDKVNSAYREAMQMQSDVMAIVDKTDRANKAIDVRNVLEKLANKINTVIKDAAKEGRNTTEFERKRDEIVEMNNTIVNKCLLFSMDNDSTSADPDELPF
jgi:MoxR-like ATPase